METQNTGMRLLKKSQRGILKMIFSRTGIILLLLALNIGGMLAVFGWFREFLPHIYGGTAIFTVGMVLYVINSNSDPTSKITWLVVIMLLPVFGALFYLFTCTDMGHKRFQRRLLRIYDAAPKAEAGNGSLTDLAKADPGAAAMAGYVSKVTGIPLCENTQATYFPTGEGMWNRMLRELEQAEKSIYLEYFIIDEGLMWGRILEILAKKAAQGVDVRVLYDGTCELFRLPKDYPEKLRSLGISCHVFAPVTPFLSTHYNYRDHRKILTIDGQVAFTGGVNLADEYINHTHPFGYWKDTAVMLRGEGAKQFQKMFLLAWNLEEREIFFPEETPEPAASTENTGYALPYYDDPLDNEQIGRQIYMDILNRAQRYVHIMTPYLILDGELESALTYAAKRGVDVRLVLPGIPDKKIPFALAKNHYPALVEAGVKIYEYTPGFVHSKIVVADDREAVVGTINFDYRSLYHHFECAAYLHSAPCIPDIEQDFLETIRISAPVTPKTIREEKTMYKILGWIMKVIAPLL